MANIWSGDFSGVTVGNSPKGTFGTHEGTFVGSVAMNYDNSTAASLAGLTFTDKTVEHLGLPGIPSNSVTFTTFTLTCRNGGRHGGMAANFDRLGVRRRHLSVDDLGGHESPRTRERPDRRHGRPSL